MAASKPTLSRVPARMAAALLAVLAGALAAFWWIVP
jgi:hypothetical protein